jgi:type II secretory pathway component GspD/PulD (secretin)
MQASLDIFRRIRASIVVLASVHGAAVAQAPAPAVPPAPPAPTATPAKSDVPPAAAKPADPPASDEPKSGVWGVPGPNAAQGGVSTPLAGPGSPGAPQAPAAQPPAPKPAAPARVDVTEDGRFSLSAQGIEVARLLELISIKARQNIVASDKVTGLVTVNLYDVPLEEALNAVLNVNGLAWKREGDFIYVLTQSEVDAQRGREARVFTLQFLSAEDTIAFIKPVLSEQGSAVALGKVEAGFEATVEDGGADSFAFAAKVMVNDYGENVARAAKLIEELDTPPKQVRVEATILTVDLTDDTAFGLDISVVGNIDFANVVGGPMGAFDAVRRNDLTTRGATPTPVTTPTPSTANAASLYPVAQGQPDPTAKIGVVTSDVAIFLQMLDEVTDSTVLARPTVTVLNRQRAQVLIGERIAYLSTTQTQTSTTQEVKYLDVGVKLRFRPFVSPDGMVRIELAPQVSTAKTKTIKAVGGEATVPDELTQELRTNIRVKSGQTIVLGGLFRETSIVTNRQIPGLGDLIPGAFSGASGQMKKQEIIFLITPTVIEDAQDYREGEKALQVAEAAKVGARAGLLPFSESHLAGNYQVQAMEAWKKGDRSTALYYVDQALRTQKNSPSMIALREAIRTDRKAGYGHELDALELLDPRQREPQNGVPLSDTFKYSKGWVGPPTPADLAKDVPPPVDDDYRPYDPLPLPDRPGLPSPAKEEKP